MSGSDVITTLNFLISLGSEIKSRLASIDLAAEEFQLLDAKLNVLLEVFKDPENKDLIVLPQFLRILDILESIEKCCTKCAKALHINVGETSETGASKAEALAKKFFKRLWTLKMIPELLAEIQRKARQLEQVHTTVILVLLKNMRTQRERTNENEASTSSVVRRRTVPENILDLDLSTQFASIDRLVGSLTEECERLRARLQEATLFPDTSAVEDYEAQNPEGASFWKYRFQKDELDVSALRYEVWTVEVSPPSTPLFLSSSLFQRNRRIIPTYHFCRNYTFLGPASCTK